MELVHYWRILTRRWWLVAALLAVVLASYPLSASHPATAYTATMRFTVGLRPEPREGAYYTYDYYYTWLTAEYLVDDLSEVVRSSVFAQDVATTSGLAVSPGAIQGSTSAGKLHRILTVQVTWGQPDELERIANAVVTVMTTHADTYFAQLGTSSAVVAVIDPPSISAVGTSLRQRLDLPLRLILALMAGVALAFLLDYVDDSVREAADLEAMGLVVLGRVPRPTRRLLRGWQKRRTQAL
jgi:capsular polysaccharide biosynthesis protein